MENEGLLMLSLIAGFIITLALFAFVYFRGLTLIAAFRDLGYDSMKLLRWTIKGRHFEKHATLIVLLSYIAWSFLEILAPAIAAPVFYALILVALTMAAFRDRWGAARLAKSPADVPRDRKILYLYLVLTAIYFATLFSAGQKINTTLLTLSFLAFLQAPPIFIIAANFVLRPFSKNGS